jgi:hypothetical protein
MMMFLPATCEHLRIANVLFTLRARNVLLAGSTTETTFHHPPIAPGDGGVTTTNDNSRKGKKGRGESTMFDVVVAPGGLRRPARWRLRMATRPPTKNVAPQQQQKESMAGRGEDEKDHGYGCTYLCAYYITEYQIFIHSSILSKHTTKLTIRRVWGCRK